MKKLSIAIVRVLSAILAVVSVGIMIFTIVSVLTFNRTDRSLFGYQFYIVLSDSMKATDFAAGDLVLSRSVDPSTLQEGDIISYISTNEENYGETVTHKIRSIVTTETGDPGFVTYGTTTDTDDESIVTYEYVLGKYAFSIPKVGSFFRFLKTTPGYIICIFTPFALLILLQGIKTIRLFRIYKMQEMKELEEEKAKIQEQADENRKMLEEIMAMRSALEKSMTQNSNDISSDKASDKGGESAACENAPDNNESDKDA